LKAAWLLKRKGTQPKTHTRQAHFNMLNGTQVGEVKKNFGHMDGDTNETIGPR